MHVVQSITFFLPDSSLEIKKDTLSSSSHALNVLRDNGFKVFSSWESLARELNVPLDTRRQLRHTAAFSEDYTHALEETLDYWIKNDPTHSWKKFLRALENTDEKEVAKKVAKLFGIGKNSAYNYARFFFLSIILFFSAYITLSCSC